MLAYRYPGLPPIHDLSPGEICAYLAWSPPTAGDDGDDVEWEA